MMNIANCFSAAVVKRQFKKVHCQVKNFEERQHSFFCFCVADVVKVKVKRIMSWRYLPPLTGFLVLKRQFSKKKRDEEMCRLNPLQEYIFSSGRQWYSRHLLQ
jgi:hypothetical protein